MALVKLRNGAEIPQIGLGTYRIPDDQAEHVVETAIKLGYRMIDTAAVYRNEEGVGRGLRRAIQSGIVTRQNLWITSKISTSSQGYELAAKAITESLEKLGLDCLDLMLVHFPGSRGLQQADPRQLERRMGTWRALEEAVDAGKIRTIGVSNYTVAHLTEMLEGSPATGGRPYARIPPAVNQFELHPCLYERDLVAYCKANAIAVEAYSSLAEGALLAEPLAGSDFPAFAYRDVTAVAQRRGCENAAVLLSWALQHGWIVIPKSTHEARLRSNFNLFGVELSAKDMALLDSISTRPGGEFRCCWDPRPIA